MRLLLGLWAIMMLTSCIDMVSERGNGVRVEETYSVDTFDKIKVRGEYKIILEQSASRDIVIETDENLLNFIKVSVTGNTLDIYSDRTLSSDEGVIINIPVQNLTQLRSSGASEVSSINPLQSRKLDIELSGAGKLDLKVDAVDMTVDVSGASAVFLEGAVNSLDIGMSGAGTMDASALEARDCYAQISGIGKILVNVSGNLEADVSGLGTVDYVGNPESVKGDVSGIGNIERK